MNHTGELRMHTIIDNHTKPNAVSRADIEPVVKREQNACQSFIDSALEQFDLTEQDATNALNHLLSIKMVTLDRVTGHFKLKDGRVWSGEVLQRAARFEQRRNTDPVE